MAPWWQTITPTEWFIAGLALLLLEVFAPGAFLLWFGIAALIVGVAVWLLPMLPWQVQIVAFALLSIGALVGYRAWRKRRPTQRSRRPWASPCKRHRRCSPKANTAKRWRKSHKPMPSPKSAPAIS